MPPGKAYQMRVNQTLMDIYLQVVESACQNGRLVNCSLWCGASGEAVERPQPDRCLDGLDHPGRGVRRQDVPRVPRLPLLPPAQPQVPSSLGGSWRSRQTAFGQMCWFGHWPHPSSVKFLVAGDNEKTTNRQTTSYISRLSWPGGTPLTTSDMWS